MKVVRKGRAAVDAYYDNAENVHVLEEGNDVFNAMLNYVCFTLIHPTIYIQPSNNNSLSDICLIVRYICGTSWTQ